MKKKLKKVVDNIIMGVIYLVMSAVVLGAIALSFWLDKVRFVY